MGGMGHMGAFGMSGASAGNVGGWGGTGGTNNMGGIGNMAGTSGLSGYGYGYTNGGPGYGNPGLSSGYPGGGAYGSGYGGYGYGSPYGGGAAMGYGYPNAGGVGRAWGGCGSPSYSGAIRWAMSIRIMVAMGWATAIPTRRWLTPRPRRVSAIHRPNVSPATGATNAVARGHYLGIDEEPVIDTERRTDIKVAKVYPRHHNGAGGSSCRRLLHSINGYLTQEKRKPDLVIANALRRDPQDERAHGARWQRSTPSRPGFHDRMSVGPGVWVGSPGSGGNRNCRDQ